MEDFTEAITDGTLRDKVRALLTHDGPEGVVVTVLSYKDPAFPAALILCHNKNHHAEGLTDFFMDALNDAVQQNLNVAAGTAN